MCLFQFSKCFEHPRAHHQENQLYQYNIWYVTLRRRPFRVQVSELHTKWSPTRCIDTIDSPDDEQEDARNM
jgi:hypothetical protein